MRSGAFMPVSIPLQERDECIFGLLQRRLGLRRQDEPDHERAALRVAVDSRRNPLIGLRGEVWRNEVVELEGGAIVPADILEAGDRDLRHLASPGLVMAC